jgi:hypothetical protein
VFPNASSPRLLMKYVRNTLSPSDEWVRAVPFVYVEVGVELVADGVPGHLPAHPRLHPCDVRLRRARGEDERGVAGAQMRKVADVVGDHGAADARAVGPTGHARFEEGAVDDQLTAAVEQVDQPRPTFWSVELIALFHR